MNTKNTDSKINYDLIEKYRIEKDIILQAMSDEIGISINVYVNCITGRNKNGSFFKTSPNARNKRKIDRWYIEHFQEIFDTLSKSISGQVIK